MGRLPEANKTLGQHFLRDQKVIGLITEDYLDKADLIVEVGPGPGALTERLSKHQKPFVVVERDQRFQENLALMVGADNVVMTDALHFELEAECVRRGFESNIWLVSNLPYNISVPLFLKFLLIPSIQHMTLMFQREVALKIFDFTNSKNPMGSLMALAQTYLDCRLLCQAPPGCFVPPPQVDSTVLSFTRKEATVIPLSDFSEFETFLRRVFQFKRKQVFKILKAYYAEEKLLDALGELNLTRDRRAESFTLPEIQKLFLSLRK